MRSNYRTYKPDGITLKWILRQYGVRTEWFDLVQDRVQWQCSVNTVMKILVP
jgi:hypothetical protein